MRNSKPGIAIISHNGFIYGVILLLFALGVSGCRSTTSPLTIDDQLKWSYGDLRLLDPADPVDPDQDLIAVYTRIYKHSFQTRLDFLDLGSYLGKDIYIAIDTNPGGSSQIKTNSTTSIPTDISWDYLIRISGIKGIELLNSHYSLMSGVHLLFAYDSIQDNIAISIKDSHLPIFNGKTKLQIIVTSPGTSNITDSVKPFSVDAPSPARVKVGFAFWNTFTSITPAQALRSWAGAHTGPMSSRHGLEYLIDGAAKTKTPLFLLDLMTADNSSALDYVNALGRIKRLEQKRILYLDRANDSDLESWIYLLVSNMNKNIGENDYAHIIKNCNLIAGINKSTQRYTTGLSIECKKLFLTAAIASNPTPLILGGNFSQSTLGDPTTASEVFSYIISHPWIEVLSIENIDIYDRNISSVFISDENLQGYTFSDNAQIEISDTNNITSQLYVKISASLLRTPDNQISKLAWQVFNTLSQPTNPELTALRANYLGQIGELVEAAKWVESPSTLQECNIDLDYDGVNECILQNDRLFMIVDREGGFIPFVFTKDNQGVHQIIGPTWEFVVGLSDPSTWNPQAGIRGDISQVLGAFQDPILLWNTYQANFSGNDLTLRNEDSSLIKTFSITENTIHISIENTGQNYSEYTIPLVIDPWHRFEPNWGDTYVGTTNQFNFRWGIKEGEFVNVFSTAPIDTIAFNDTHAMMLKPEGPNYDYSRGHYLPYPMALVQISGVEKVTIEIQIGP